MTAALLDRLLHHAHIVPISGQSYRLKNQRQAGMVHGMERTATLNSKSSRHRYGRATPDLHDACWIKGKEKSGVSVLSRCMLKNWGCCVKLGLVYAVNSRLARYSRGLSEPREILMRFSLYQRI